MDKKDFYYEPLGDFVLFIKDAPENIHNGIYLPVSDDDGQHGLNPPYTGDVLFPDGRISRGAVDCFSGYALLDWNNSQITIAMDKENLMYETGGDDTLPKMLNGYILIKDIGDRSRHSESGLWLPDMKYQRLSEVIAVPDDTTIVKPGDIIVKPIGMTTPVEIGGEQYDCIYHKKIFARLPEKVMKQN